MLAVPLGSVLLAKIAGAGSGEERGNVTTEVSTERRLRRIMETALEEEGGGRVSLTDFDIRRMGQEWRVQAAVRMPEQFQFDAASLLLRAATESLKGEVVLQLATERYTEVRSNPAEG